MREHAHHLVELFLGGRLVVTVQRAVAVQVQEAVEVALDRVPVDRHVALVRGRLEQEEHGAYARDKKDGWRLKTKRVFVSMAGGGCEIGRAELPMWLSMWRL